MEISAQSCVMPGGAWRGGPSGASAGSTLAQEQGAWPLWAGWGPAARGPSSALAAWSSGHCQRPPQPCDGSGGARLWSTCRSGRTGSLRGQHRAHAPQQAAAPRGSRLPPPAWLRTGDSACRAIWRLPCRSWQTQALRGFQPEKKTSWRAGSQAWLCPSQPRASSERRSWRRPSCPREVWHPGGGLLAHPSHPYSCPIPVLLLSWESGPTKPRPLDTASACLKP